MTSKSVEFERIQALKFVNHSLEIAPQILPRSLIAPIVAISLSADDPLRISCIQVLGKAGLNTNIQQIKHFFSFPCSFAHQNTKLKLKISNYKSKNNFTIGRNKSSSYSV